jgi:hypothetical protein
MPISIRKHVRSETLLFVLSGAALVAVFGGGLAAPAPAASSVPSDRLDEVPVIATTPPPGATIDVDKISSNVDSPVSVGNSPDSFDQQFRRAGFAQVSTRAGVKRAARIDSILVNAEHRHTGGGTPRNDAPQSFDPAHAR